MSLLLSSSVPLLLSVPLLSLAVAASPLPAAAPPPPPQDATSSPPAAGAPPALRRGPWPAAAAVLPGLVVHGSGHFAAGDRQTAAKLLAAEGVGLLAIVGGVVGLAATGASRRVVSPLIWTSTFGVGAFTTSALADLYGVLAPAGGTGIPVRQQATAEARAGARFVYDPTLPARTFLGPGLDLRGRLWRLSSTAWVGLDHGNVRAEALLARRLFGPSGRGAPPARDGSFLDLGLGFVHHWYGPEQFQMTTGDLRIDGRYDLARFAPSLTGAFVEGQAGLGLGAYHYRTGRRATEANELLLARFAFGLYLGRGPQRAGEVRAYYDNRHDDFAGGLKLPGLGSGAPGHFGIDGAFYLGRTWGLQAEVQAGSAYVAGLALVRRSQGGAR